MYEPFGASFYEWWAGFSPLIRYGVGIVMLIVGIVLWQFDSGGPYFDGTLIAAGVLLILLAGRTRDE